MQPDRLNLEWLLINALRENLSLIQDGETQTYNEVIRFAKESFGALFQKENSAFGRKRIVSKEFEKYEQEAKALSQKEKREVTAKQLILQRIKHINELLKHPENKKGAP